MSWSAFRTQALPTRKHERWKYADLTFLAEQDFTLAQRLDDSSLVDVISQHRLRHNDAILLVSVNGYFEPALSDMHKLPEQVIASSLQNAKEKHAELLELHNNPQDHAQYPFAAFNARMEMDGLFLYVSPHSVIEAPIHLLSITTGDRAVMAHPRHIFVISEFAKLTLVEEYYSQSDQPCLMNVVSDFVVQRGAMLDINKIQNECREAVHVAHTFVYQKQDSQVSITQFAFGARFSRDEVVVQLQESGADCRTAGFYHGHYPNQYIDHHLDISHLAPHSHSEMLYKGIIDQHARAVFNGRLLVNSEAQKTTAYQANHNLLLSTDAEVNSKPELEIYADDVKCKHGATTGQIDQDALFYMRARGMSHDQAMSLLLQGFVQDIINRVNHPGIKQRILASSPLDMSIEIVEAAK